MATSLLRRAWEIYREKGAAELAESTYQYVFNRSPFHSHIYQKKRREASIARWNLIEPHLSEDDGALLDVGCNIGLFSKWSAEKGLYAFGIDRFANDATRDAAMDTVRQNQNVSIMQSVLTPENVEDFPTFDVVLLLSVYHHWYSEFGEENAKEMLAAFTDSEKIFFEPPSESHRYVDVQAPYIDNPHSTADIPNFKDHNRESIIDYHMELLSSIFGDTHEIEVIGSSDRLDVNRYLFYLEKQSS